MVHDVFSSSISETLWEFPSSLVDFCFFGQAFTELSGEDFWNKGGNIWHHHGTRRFAFVFSLLFSSFFSSCSQLAFSIFTLHGLLDAEDTDRW